MKDEYNNNNEKPINPDEISKLDPFTISKIVLIDGTILVVQKKYSSFKNNPKNNSKNNNNGGTINLKFNQIQNSNKKSKNIFSYIEWDFPKSKFRNYSYQRNINYELVESKTEQNENHIKVKDISRDNPLNRNIKNRNYSFYESKHISNKNNNNVSDIESKNISGIFIKNEDNYNFKEISDKDNNNGNKENEKENNNYNNKNYTNNKEKKEEIKDNVNENKSKINNNNTNIKKEVKEINNNNKDEDLNNKKESNIYEKFNKDKLTFREKIRLIKYGLLDNDSNYNISGLIIFLFFIYKI